MCSQLTASRQCIRQSMVLNCRKNVSQSRTRPDKTRRNWTRLDATGRDLHTIGHGSIIFPIHADERAAALNAYFD